MPAVLGRSLPLGDSVLERNPPLGHIIWGSAVYNNSDLSAASALARLAILYRCMAWHSLYM